MSKVEKHLTLRIPCLQKVCPHRVTWGSLNMFTQILQCKSGSNTVGPEDPSFESLSGSIFSIRFRFSGVLRVAEGLFVFKLFQASPILNSLLLPPLSWERLRTHSFISESIFNFESSSFRALGRFLLLTYHLAGTWPFRG